MFPANVYPELYNDFLIVDKSKKLDWQQKDR